MNDEFYNTPVLIICFNRPQFVSRQVASLRAVKPSKIFIFSDGPRPENMEDTHKIGLVRKLYLDQINWNCQVVTNFQEENFGCSAGPISAMQWFFKNEKEGIILEDDIIPSVDFFTFMSKMLDQYRTNKKIVSISGCNFGYEGPPNSYLFCKIMNMWGWATWADRFQKIDFSINSWKRKKYHYIFLLRHLRNNIFDIDLNWIKYWKYILDKTINTGNLTWWDYQVIYNQLEKKQLTVYPNVNLVTNIGFGEDAIHTTNEENPVGKLENKKMDFPLVEPAKTSNNFKFYEEYLKPIWAQYRRPNIKFYLGRTINRFIEKNHTDLS